MELTLNDFDNVDVEGKWFDLPKNTEYRFKIKPVTKGELKKTRSQYTSIQFDKKTHQKIEIEDPEKRLEVWENLTAEIVLDWGGVKEKTEDGKVIPAEFSKEKFKKLLDKNYNRKLYVEFNEEEQENETVTFSGWFMKIAMDPGNSYDDDTANL